MDSATSSSDEDMSSSESDSVTSSSSSSVEQDKIEIAKICGVKFELPQQLCENKQLFKEFFSARMWNNLTESQKQHLKNFLPCFPENDTTEKNNTLQKIFNWETIGFTNPLEEFHKNLKAGNYRSDVQRIRHMMRKAQRRESKCQQRRYMRTLVKEVLASRQWLIGAASSLPPGTPGPLRPNPSISFDKQQDIANLQYRNKKRYYQELAAIRNEVGETDPWSEDENYPEGPGTILMMSRKQKRTGSGGGAQSGDNQGPEPRVPSTMSDLKSLRTAPALNLQLNDETYRMMLLKHKRRRLEQEDHSDLNTNGVSVKDVTTKTSVSNNNKKVAVHSVHKQPMPASQNTHELKVSHSKKPTIKKEPIRNTVHIQPQEIKTNNYTIPPASLHLSSQSGHSSNSELDMSDNESIIDQIPGPSSVPTASTPKSVPRTPKVQTPSTVTPKQIVSNSPIRSPQIASVIPITNTIPSLATQENILNSILVTSNQTTSAVTPPLTTSRTFNTIRSLSQYGKVAPATLSDLEGIDMYNLPVDLDDSNIGIIDQITSKTPELMQDTHATFFSLIRDIICSTPDHRMSLAMLDTRLKAWQENPISPLNDWYNAVDNWAEVLQCAVSFLNGDFSEQPEDFVPYLELKTQLNEYQWIGAGRDSDNLLAPLFQFWLEHREEMTAEHSNAQETEVNIIEVPKSPPPPRWPTNWVVRKATPEEVEQFREQERLRFDNPHKAFTYRMHGYESVVGPLKGMYNQTAGVNKARGHSMLSSDRPNFVTILTLVRDATARLPNGEGTRADICELLKSSQYISQTAPDNVLQSVVSGALDRMHTEYDPCVKYDTKRKIWIYLHRNRTEEEFERIHQQHQGLTKHQKKNTSRKNKSKAKQDKNTTTPASVKQNTNVQVPETVSTNEVSVTSTPVVEKQTQNKRFKAPNSRASPASVVTTAAPVINTTVANAVSSIINTSEPNKSPAAGTSLLINQNLNKQSLQSLINKNSMLDKTERNSPVSQLKILSSSGAQSLVSNQVKSIVASSTGGPPMQSIIAPRGNSPVTKPMQAKGANKSVVKIINSTQNKSLINPSLISNQQQTIYVKQQVDQKQLIGTQNQTYIQTISGKQKQVDSGSNVVTQITSQQPTQTKQTLIAPQNQILQTIVQQQQPRQTMAARQILQSITSTQKQQQTVLSQQQVAVSSQQVIQTISGQKQQTLLAQSQKQIRPTLTPVQQQFIQSIKQQQAKGQVQQQTSALSQQQQALLKQQVTFQQLQKLQQQQQAVTIATKGTSLLDQSQQRTTAVNASKPVTVTANQAPLVAKVLTNAAGQVISVESLLAHQKQHGSLPQGTTLRVAGGKPGQTNLIQLSGNVPNQVAQFAVVSQGNIVSMTAAGQPRLIASVAQTHQTVTSSAGANTQIIMAASPKTIQSKNTRQPQQNIAKLSAANKVTHQLINAKFITAQSLSNAKLLTTANQQKQIVSQAQKIVSVNPQTKQSNATKTVLSPNQAAANTIRMVNSTGLNFAHISGKPILLASKGNTIQNIQGQNIILRSQGNPQGSPTQSLVIANQPRVVTQQGLGNSQQIVLGTPLKLLEAQGAIKGQHNDSSGAGQTVLLSASQDGSTNVQSAQRVVLASQTQGGQLLAQQILLPSGFQGGAINIKTLQGLKVIPLAQQTKGTTATSRQQVFTRIMNPTTVQQQINVSGVDSGLNATVVSSSTPSVVTVQQVSMGNTTGTTVTGTPVTASTQNTG